MTIYQVWRRRYKGFPGQWRCYTADYDKDRVIAEFNRVRRHGFETVISIGQMTSDDHRVCHSRKD